MAARILAVIGELDYVPQAAAHGLALQRTNAIGLMLPEISGDYFAIMLRGVEAATTAAGFDLLISARATQLLPSLVRPALGEHNADRPLVFTNSLPDAELLRIARCGFPLVLLHQSSPPDAAAPCVTIKKRRGALALVSHLIEVHGCQRIAFLAGPPGRGFLLANTRLPGSTRRSCDS